MVHNKEIKTFEIPISQSKLIQLYGGFCYVLFLLIWISCSIVPLILVLCIYYKKNILLLTTVAFILPFYFLRTLPELPYIFKKLSLLIVTDINNWTGPCKIIVESPDFETNQKQLLGIHPHGVTSIGLMNIVKSNIFKRFYVIVTEAIIWLQPIVWSILSTFTTLRGASHTSFKNTMKREESPLIMFPGGFQESTILDWGVDEIYIKNRYGFIKYCMQYNYRIRPVYVFGECLTFNNTKFARNLRLFLNKFSIPGIFPYGDYWWLPFLPKKDVPLLIVIGDSIKVPYFPENPPRDEIKKYHKIYIERLQELYRAYSPKYLESFADYEVIKKYKEIKLPEISLM